jgi:hypothetical protein
MRIPVPRRVRTVAGLVALTASIAAGMFSAIPATAAPTCYGDYCSGRYARGTGCNADAVNETRWRRVDYYYVIGVSNKTGHLGWLSLWWSPTCGTHWAEWYASRNDASGYNSGPLRAEESNGYRVSRTGDFTRRLALYYGPMIYSRTNCVSAAFDNQWGTVRTDCHLN